MSQEIINYLREGKRRGFTLDRLKQELLQHGFDGKIIDESIAVVEGRRVMNSVKPEVQIPVIQKQVQAQPMQIQTQPLYQTVSPIQSHQVSSMPYGESSPKMVDHSKLLNPEFGEKKKGHKGLIIFLVIILILLIGGGVAAWFYRDAFLGYFGL